MEVRRPGDPDFGGVLALVQAYDRSVIGDTDWTEAELREEWAEVDRSQDAWLLELGGRIAGYATVRLRESGHVLADGYVHPDHAGRGVGAAILALTEERARELAAREEAPRVVVHNATLQAPDGDAADELYEGCEYTAVRRFWRMVIDLVGEPFPSRTPEGIVVEPYAPARDARTVHAAIEEAFVDHWNHVAEPWETWERTRLARGGHDPTLWLVARDGDEVAGAILGSWKRNGDWGYVDTLGVRRSWRGRGIGEALLRALFRELWRRGERRVALGVDAESTTEATRLYERVGMRVFWRAVVWEKELSVPRETL